MPDYQLKLSFNSRKSFWNEVYYKTFADPSLAETGMKALAQARTQLVGKDVECEGATLSDLAIRNDSKLATSHQWVAKKYTNDPADNPSSSIRVRFVTVDKNRATRHFRGCPDEAISQNQTTNPFWNSFELDVEKFGNYLVNNAYALKVLRTDTIYTERVITGLAVDPADGYTLLTVNTDDMTNPSNVIIKKVKGFNVKDILGLHKAYIVNATSVKIRVNLPSNSVALELGTLQLVGHKLSLLEDYDIISPGSRQTQTNGLFFTAGARRVRSRS